MAFVPSAASQAAWNPVAPKPKFVPTPASQAAWNPTAPKQTSSNSGSTKKSSGSSGGSSNKSSGGGSSSVDSQTAKLRNEISSGWDSYINSLNNQMGGLDNQRGLQEGIVNSQYNTGVNSLGLQRDQGVQTLDRNRMDANQNQVGSLRDISSSIRNAFQAGNVFLGTRGASDSSAADQYSYALNKEGTRQRSDVMNNTANILADIDARAANLENIYNTEKNNLMERKNQGLQQVAMWFSEAQNQIRQMQAQGKLQKSQDLNNMSKDLLNRAFAEMDRVNQGVSAQSKALDDWANQTANSLREAGGALSTQANVNYDLPQAEGGFGAPTVDSSGNAMANYGGGGFWGGQQKKESPFGQTYNTLFGGY